MLTALILALGAWRVPADPGAFWIWPDMAEARLWVREHPALRLCVTKEPDGIATKRC